jgi:hypothetical protein
MLRGKFNCGAFSTLKSVDRRRQLHRAGRGRVVAECCLLLQSFLGPRRVTRSARAVYDLELRGPRHMPLNDQSRIVLLRKNGQRIDSALERFELSGEELPMLVLARGTGPDGCGASQSGKVAVVRPAVYRSQASTDSRQLGTGILASRFYFFSHAAIAVRAASIVAGLISNRS